MNLETPYCSLPRLTDGIMVPDYANQSRAITDSDFIPNVIASLHLHVPRHLTSVK